MEQKYIEIKGARVNNLKNISVNIPHNKLVVIAGVSGSGKSSLAFDTLYAEGQRRYVESLSAYARQFLGRLAKPECDYIRNLPPAVAIEQKTIARNPRSTVATSTEIYDYLRILFARIGHIYSPISGQEVKRHTPDDLVTEMLRHEEGERFMLVAPLCPSGISPKGEKNPSHEQIVERLKIKLQQGYSRVVTLGDNYSILDIEEILNTPSHLGVSAPRETREPRGVPYGRGPFLLIDRLKVSNAPATISRLLDSAETAFSEGDGECALIFNSPTFNFQLSTFNSRLEADGMKFQEPTPELFAFNSPVGACPTCEGFGNLIDIDPNLVIPDPSLSVYDGCVACWRGEKLGEWKKYFIRRAAIDNFPIFTPYRELSEEHRGWLWHGLPCDKNMPREETASIDEFFRMVKASQYKIQYRVMLARYRGKTVCPDCHGSRLRKEALYVRIANKTISDIVSMPVSDALDWFEGLNDQTTKPLNDQELKIASRLLTEITSRLHYLNDIGLGYLTLDRPSNTLSGGESQRVNLTTILGSPLVGTLYVLDEPSIGLHSRDTHRLIDTLKQLRDLGNTVVVVEHDEDILHAADQMIEIGPDAGALGGRIIPEGEGYTAKYLDGTLSIPVPTSRRAYSHSITFEHLNAHNLRDLTVRLPLGVMTVITGVSGSGKSTLVKEIIKMFPALPLQGRVGGGLIIVDQSPVGKSTRSNPATYMKAWDAIRQLFAQQPLAKQLDITAAHFSFNTDGGRCEECQGAGTITIEMQFMADLTMPCEACHGKRFKPQILEVRYQGKNVDDILNMTVDEAIEFFSSERAITALLLPLQQVGLGYITLGQSTATLSGGENQRLKLAYYLAKENHEPSLFIFDEPTTGLHFHDIRHLLAAFDRLIARGHTILVVEHNMDIIKCADHIIDLGPEAGAGGGTIVAEGTPEEVAECQESHTAKFLKEKLA